MQVRFLQTHHQGLCQLFLDGVLGPTRLAWYTWWCPCFSVVPEVTYEASWGHCVSSKKALQGSEMETRELLGGTVENRVWGYCFALHVNQWFFYPSGPPNIWLLAAPLHIFFKIYIDTSKYILIFSFSLPHSPVCSWEVQPGLPWLELSPSWWSLR